LDVEYDLDMESFKDKITVFALIYLGVVSLVAQMVLLRELVISFFGNELFLGLILGLWLLSTGLGSLWLARLVPGRGFARSAALYLLLVPVMAGSFLLAKTAGFFVSGHGVMPAFGPAVLWSVLAIVPVGLLLGVLFVSLLRDFRSGVEQAVSRAYVWESLGFFAGAVLFNLFLVRFLGLEVIMLLALAACLVAGLLVWGNRPKAVRLWPIIGLIFVLSVLACFYAPVWEKALSNRQYPDGDLLELTNTRYGTVAATEMADQVNFYYQGRLTDIYPNRFRNELLAHLPLLAHPSPDRVLVVGNGFTGLLDEVRKHDPKEIVYVELDKELLQTGSRLGAEPPASVEVVPEDASQYLAGDRKEFDVVILNYSNPTTLAENRYFTREFFQQAKKNLSNSGGIAMLMEAAPNYTAGPQKQVLATLYHTLAGVFPSVSVWPDNEVMFWASHTRAQTGPEAVRQRYKQRELDNRFVTGDMAAWRIKAKRGSKLKARLAGAEAGVNRDKHPVLFLAQIKAFLEKTGWTGALLRLLAGLFLAGLAGLFWYGRRLGRRRHIWLAVSAVPEFALIAYEVILALWFQTVHGYLYTQLSLIIALILVGIAGGSAVMSRLLGRHTAKRLIVYSYACIFGLFVLSSLLFWQVEAVFQWQASFYILSLAAGFVMGSKFPLVNQMYLKNSRSAGAVYGADLIGGAAGAVLAGSALLPAFGLVGSMLFLTGLVLAAWLGLAAGNLTKAGKI